MGLPLRHIARVLDLGHDCCGGAAWEPFDASGFPADLRFINALAAVPDPRGGTLHAPTNPGTYSYTLVDR
jgi:hypothetical protein